MILHIAGIAHAHPLGQLNWELWLQDLRARYGTASSFVAVDWHEALFGKIKNQRSVLQALAHRSWLTHLGQHFTFGFVDCRTR